MQLFKSQKNNKQIYYLHSFIKEIYPNSIYRNRLGKTLESMEQYNLEYIKHRVNYYNKMSESMTLSGKAKPLSELKLKKYHKTYYFDSQEFCRYFHPDLRIKFKFGDITKIPKIPAIVKSRPITTQQDSAILFKLNKVRHFTFTKDNIPFENKKDKLIGRNHVKKKQTHRIRFYEMYFNHPLCNLGQINKSATHPEWVKKKISIEKHLKYKFILCIEGVDVASNLKWVMSSNSIAVMPKPKYETWFMENTLKPNYHYIEIKADYSDLEEKLNYYINNPSACLKIIKNANLYVEQFKNLKRERLISLLVLEKYFVQTNQLPKRNHLLY